MKLFVIVCKNPLSSKNIKIENKKSLQQGYRILQGGLV